MDRPPGLNRRSALALAGAALVLPGEARAVAPPSPFGAAPSRRQLAWQRMEANAFVHFTVNTFTDREWGLGDEDPAVFNPTDFDADQIAGAVQAAGLKGLVLTAKHHDGFCLWPTMSTEHCIRRSPFRGGQGDVVGEVAKACARRGLKFGVYLSPWDRNRADYGQASYVAYYRAQLAELLTRYGPIFEVWFDGANGGDGYYGGAREKRVIPPGYYDWPTTMALVRRLQPEAVTFGVDGADVRWVGNEKGYAGEPCWATVPSGPYIEAQGAHGVAGGAVWRPAEADVSIRPGWFWHPSEDGQARSPEDLMSLYFASVGRGANLLLNIPPDRRGRIPDADAAKLAAWGRQRAALFATDLAAGGRAQATQLRGGDPAYAAQRVLDRNPESFWTCDDGVTQASLVIDLPVPRAFDVVRVREAIALGQRVRRFALDAAGPDGRWIELARHDSVGVQRLVRLEKPFRARRVRLRILNSAAAPAISELGLFRTPWAQA